MEDTWKDIGKATESTDDRNSGKDKAAVRVAHPQENERKEAFVYRQDVISLKTKDNIRGLVMEVAGEYDSDDSSSDDSEVEDVQNGGKAETQTHGGADGDVTGSGVDEYNPLPDGQLRVTWTDGTETLENVDDIIVVDRSFMHGDLVASSTDPTGQLGQVMDVTITVDLQLPNGEIVRGVSSRDLRHIRDFTVGDFVVYGPWLGRVDEVMDTVTVMFDDGSVCKVSRADPMRLKPVKPMMDDANSPYYPGQRVRALTSSVFKNSRWLSGLWKASRLEGTVSKVETVSVVVYWIASAYFNSNQEPVPSDEIHPKYLSPLSCFSYSNWQLADWCFFPYATLQQSSAFEASIREVDTKECTDDYMENIEGSSFEVSEAPQSSTEPPLVIKQRTGSENNADSKEFNPGCKSEVDPSGKKVKRPGDDRAEAQLLPECSSSTSSLSVSKEQSHENCAPFRKKLRKIIFKKDKKTKRRDEQFERALFITNTMTTVDVAWQDGTKQHGISSTSLVPIHSPNDYEFFPEQYVMDKVANDDDDSSQKKRIGLVKSFNAKDRTVCVRWLKCCTVPHEFKEFEDEEIISAYELDAHPDYDYCYGDVVVRLPPVTSPAELGIDKTAVGNMESASTEKDSSDNMHIDGGHLEPSPGDQSSHFTSMSWVGNIVGLESGYMDVKWGDGVVSKVGPHEIYVVGRDDDVNTLDAGSEVSDGASWETVDNNENDNNNDADADSQKDSVSQNHQEESGQNGENLENSAPRSGPLSVSLAAIGFVTRLASEFFFRGKKQADTSGSNVTDEVESEEPLEDSDSEEPGVVAETTEENDMEIKENVETVSSTESTNAGKAVDVDHPHLFGHFDIVQCPADHHFIEGSLQGTGGKKWIKKVQQEWVILEKNLPDNVYVRVYEDRMDLLRAVIIGTSGTPYQDGLFFFDFYLPPEYPQVPPSVYYHSGGLRVNPNLYVDGKVCLSLLNTWTGKGIEVWDPLSSSILQVLVSIQGLVLNEKPYFNEAGYEKQVGTVEGEKNSLPYNENTYLLNLKSMLYLLKRSPLGFEGLVMSHFRNRGQYILKACDAYFQGALIGSLSDDACTTEKSKEHSCSVGFKLALTKLLPRVYSALKDAGADCEQFSHLQNPDSSRES